MSSAGSATRRRGPAHSVRRQPQPAKRPGQLVDRLLIVTAVATFAMLVAMFVPLGA